jgi:hypothetical protein
MFACFAASMAVRSRALPAGSVPFVRDLLVVHALEGARPLLDRPLDVVERHVRLLGGVDRRAQAGVARGVAAARPCGDGDLLDQLGEVGAAPGIGHGLLALDLLPLAVAGHDSPPGDAGNLFSARDPSNERA